MWITAVDRSPKYCLKIGPASLPRSRWYELYLISTGGSTTPRRIQGATFVCVTSSNGFKASPPHLNTHLGFNSSHVPGRTNCCYRGQYVTKIQCLPACPAAPTCLPHRHGAGGSSQAVLFPLALCSLSPCSLSPLVRKVSFERGSPTLPFSLTVTQSRHSPGHTLRDILRSIFHNAGKLAKPF